MKKRPSVNAMVRAIERRHCIREIWRCNAGWGVMYAHQPERPLPKELLAGTPRPDGLGVVAYYGTIEEAVRAEYAVQVEGKPRPKRRAR